MPFDFYLATASYQKSFEDPTLVTESQVCLSLGGVISHFRRALDQALFREGSVVKFLEGKSIASFTIHCRQDLELLAEQGELSFETT